MRLRIQGMLRALKWTAYPLFARARAALPWGNLSDGPVYFLGCGRSGTTALGRTIARHKNVVYLFEPLHYWYAVDPRTDHLNFFGGQGRCFLDAADVTPAASARFNRLFGQVQSLSGGRTIVEKLPTNVLRLGWLDRLSPGAKFVHIVRDGRAVCKSIDGLSRTNDYKVFGKASLHQWWGERYHKWSTFGRECRERDLFPEALASIGFPGASQFPAMAAYEWLVSLRYVRESAAALGIGPDRFLEIRYEELTYSPEATLKKIEELAGLPHDPGMVKFARTYLDSRDGRPYSLALPEPLYSEFIAVQRRLGYPTDGIEIANQSASAAG